MTEQPKAPLAPFSERDVAITLKGSEWFILMKRLAGQHLTDAEMMAGAELGAKLAHKFSEEVNRKE